MHKVHERIVYIACPKPPRKSVLGMREWGSCPSGLPENVLGGGGGGLEPLFQPPPPPGGGSKGWLAVFHVFHAYAMQKALSQSVTVTVTVTVIVTVTVSLRGGGGGPPTVVSCSNKSPLPIGKLAHKVSDLCIAEISVWPLQPLFTTPRTEAGGVLVTGRKHTATQKNPRQWYHRRLSALL